MGVAVVVAELKDLARLSSTLGLSDTDLPELRALAERERGARDAASVISLVEEAAEQLEPRERDAVLLLLADTDDRWARNLRERMTLAGRHLGFGYDTFRRTSPQRQSHYEVLLGRLASQLVASATPGAPPTPASPGTHDAPLPAVPARRRGVPAALALAVVGVIVGAAFGAWWVLSDDEAPRVETVVDGVPDGCDIPLGAGMDPTAVPSEVAGLLAGAYEAAGGVAALGCPLRTAYRWGELWAQPLAGAAEPAGSITVHLERGSTLWMDAGLYRAYESSVSGRLQELGRFPESVELRWGAPVLNLSGGDLIVAHFPGGPAYWVPVEAVEAWEAHGAGGGPLGLPMADVNYLDGRLQQHYAGGVLRLGDDDTVDVEVVDAAEVERAVDALPRRSAGILRLYDSTAWWLDAEGRRSWIPDGGTWECLGGDDAVIEREAPGWVVGAFEAAGRATCP